MRKSAASWAFTLVAVFALTFAACMSGDDDDDEESFECDHGQPSSSAVGLLSPIQECVNTSEMTGDECRDIPGMIESEVEWVCHCRTKAQCQHTKDEYGYD